MKLSRRQTLHYLALGAGLSFFGLPLIGCSTSRSNRDLDYVAGVKVAEIPFVGEGDAPMNIPIQSELDGRLFTDLSNLSDKDYIIPVAHFYVRSRASQLLHEEPWNIQMIGPKHRETYALAKLMSRVRPQGTHLMECAGNSRSAHFGMLSCATWTGVPIATLLQDFGPPTNGNRILVSGFDEYVNQSSSSIPGASWIFEPADLLKCGAFLATQMNESMLALDHGFPIRLVIPGWYGCACIKWVNEIRYVPTDVTATSQMQEYATRTNQPGVPERASEYSPALIEPAAMPIRVEEWSVHGRPAYRVLGILWGSLQSIDALRIQFSPNEPYVPVRSIEPAPTLSGWRFWHHDWQPRHPGTYPIRLQIVSAQLSTPRVDRGYYVRAVHIDRS